jgi:hypothetical protein
MCQFVTAISDRNLRWFISNCSGNENLLKLPRGEVYDMLIVRTDWKVGGPNSFRRYDKCNMPPFPPYGAILTRLRITSYRNNPNCSTVIEFFNKVSILKMSNLVIIYKKTWYFSESKTIDAHCRGAKIYFPILSGMLFWEACAKLNV